METDTTTDPKADPDSPEVAGCPAPICSGACVAAVGGYMLERSLLTERLIKITHSPKWDGYERAIRTITDALERIDAEVNRICLPPSAPRSQGKYTGHVPCRECGTTHWMHGPCPQNAEGQTAETE